MDAQLHISTDEEVISPVCDFTFSWCLSCGLSEPEAIRFTIGVSELITDIILFAYPENSKAYFDIEYRHTLSNLELIVSEVGEPFDPDRHRYNVQEAHEEENFEGAGLLLIRRFCDEFLFINKGKEGKEFRLSKSLDVASIDALLEQAPSLQEAEFELADEQEADQTDEHFSVTQIKPSDAEDIAKLIYRTYEYTYPKEDMYFPKKIEKIVLGKEKLGVIARNNEGEAVGYFAVLKKNDSNIAEVGEAVVSPSYRRKGIMSKMMQHLIDTARDQKIGGLFGQAVTLHPASQKVNHKYGFKSTALMLADTDSAIFKGFDEYPQPVSVMIDFLHLFPRQKRKIYLPEKYKEIIFHTYKKLQVPIIPAKADSYDLARKSEIKLLIDYANATALIVVKKYGPDFRSVLSEMLGSLKSQEKPNAIYLDLPLENSATPDQLSNIDMLGFIYCGLIPLFHRDSDFLRMQHIVSPLDFKLIEVFSEFGNKIKSLVADEYRRNT